MEKVTEQASLPLERLIERRKEKLKILREKGIDPYSIKFAVVHSTKEVIEKYGSLKNGEVSSDKVQLAGRIVSFREMGRSTFAHLQNEQVKIQVYLREDKIGQREYDFFLKVIDLGDFLGVEGNPFRTRTGELSIAVDKFSIVSKSLRPLPEKWHRLKDIETRYRQRYLDVLVNPQVRKILDQRSRTISLIRSFLDKNGFLEVETPMMQVLPGGATAKPFSTYHNALGIGLYLRIAPELYLKRLLVGGYEKIYELNKNFRNEGISTRHNPEFTMLEVYQAYADYEEMMRLCEEMVFFLVKEIIGKEEIDYQGKKISVKPPFKRVRLFDLLKQYIGTDENTFFKEIKEKPTSRVGTVTRTTWEPETKLGERLYEIAKEIGIEVKRGMPEHKIFDHIFEKKILPELSEPIFVTEHLKKWTPLAKSKKDNPEIVERFELFIAGEEIANAYTELNDPIEQRIRLEEQAQEKSKGDEEAMFLDEDFIRALEYGMPPCAGLGIGIDRLVMVLTDSSSIRDTITFPLLRPE